MSEWESERMSEWMKKVFSLVLYGKQTIELLVIQYRNFYFERKKEHLPKPMPPQVHYPQDLQPEIRLRLLISKYF